MLVTLGWMLFAGLPFPAHKPLEPGHRTEPRIAVWTDHDAPYRRGEGARVFLTAGEPAHVAVFRVDTDGRIRVLFPREPWGDTFVRDERTLEISGSRGGRSFVVDDYPGIGYLFAIASPDRFAFEDITRGEYWDYRAIDGGRLRGDPHVLLRELADRLTRGAPYGYDLVPYYVDRRYDYPRFVCYDCHAYASYEEWDPYDRACSRFRMVIYDDPAAYPYQVGRGRNVVAPAGLGGPRYLFRDADPRREYLTRVSGSAGTDRPASPARGRTSEDVGGRGAVPVPGVQSLGRPVEDTGGAAEPPADRRALEERRRPPAEGRRTREPEDVPDGLQPAEGERRLAPEQRPARPPRSTGEPELRRRPR